MTRIYSLIYMYKHMQGVIGVDQEFFFFLSFFLSLSLSLSLLSSPLYVYKENNIKNIENMQIIGGINESFSHPLPEHFVKSTMKFGGNSRM